MKIEPTSHSSVEPPDKAPRKFNLMRWYSGLSLVCILATSIVTAVLLARYYAADTLQRDSALTMDFVGTIVMAANARHAAEPSSGDGRIRMTAIEHLLAGHEHTVDGHSESSHAGLREYFDVLARMPEVLRVTIYRQDRSIVWSTDEPLVGRRFEDNDELEEAFTGVPVAHEAVAGSGEKEEHTVTPEPGSRYVENYLPVWGADHASVAGVVELYKSPSSLLDALDRGRRIAWASAMLGGIALYVALFWVVRRASQIIAQQQDMLVESETMATIGEMAGIIAHNIRNPLASIRSSAELTLEADSREIARDAARDTIVEADRMEHWVHELLSFSRPGSLETTAIELTGLLSRCTDRAQGAAAARKVALSFTASPELPPVRGDASLLAQALGNVINNALEATPPGGKVTLGTRRSEGGRTVTVSVEDTGTGLDPEQLAQAFKPFVTTKNRGLGLGLPLTRRLLQRMGATIELASTGGKGTTAIIKLQALSR